MLVWEAVPHELERRRDVALASVVREALGGGRRLGRSPLLVDEASSLVVRYPDQVSTQEWADALDYSSYKYVLNLPYVYQRPFLYAINLRI